MTHNKPLLKSVVTLRVPGKLGGQLGTNTIGNSSNTISNSINSLISMRMIGLLVKSGL